MFHFEHYFHFLHIILEHIITTALARIFFQDMEPIAHIYVHIYKISPTKQGLICAIGSMSGKKIRANAVVMKCSKIMCKK